MSGVQRVYVTVALDVDRAWYDGLNTDRPQDVVARLVEDALDESYSLPDAPSVTVVRCEASELPT